VIGRTCAGVGSAIIAMGTMIMVSTLGGGNERAGFKIVAAIVAVIFVITEVVCAVSVREKEDSSMETVSVGEMFRALFSNDQALVVVLSIVLINSALYLTSNLIIYFFKYDFGGEAWTASYTLFSTVGGAFQILGMMIVYPMLRKKLANTSIFKVALTLSMSGYAIILILCFTGQSGNLPLLLIPGALVFAANGILSVLTTVFLSNSVDYGQLKTGHRDESVIFSMQTFVVKLASGIAALIASISLSVNNLKADAGNEAEQLYDFSKDVADSAKLGLRMTMTIIPIIGLIVAIIIFRKKFILTEKKMEEINSNLGR
jgi:melibiose permease